MNTAFINLSDPHQGMDDMAEFGASHNTPCAPFPVIEAASACTEIGAEPDPRDVDLTHIFPLERAFRDYPATTWACVFLTLGVLAYAFTFAR